MIDSDAPRVFITTASGLKYRVLRKGTGAAPNPTSTVRFHFHGWLDDYGKRGAPPLIPPDATLHVLIELLVVD